MKTVNIYIHIELTEFIFIVTPWHAILIDNYETHFMDEISEALEDYFPQSLVASE